MSAPTVNQLDALRNSIPLDKHAHFEDQLSGKEELRNLVCDCCLAFPEPGQQYMMWGCNCTEPLCMSCGNDIIARSMSDNATQSARCPTCRDTNPLRRSNGDLVAHSGKMDVLRALPLECPFHDPEGCTFRGTAPELINHLKTCTHMPICCPMHGQGCTWLGKPCDLQAHLTATQHGQYLATFCAQQGTKIDTLNTKVSKLQAQVAQATGAATLARTTTDSLKRSFDTFARDMRSYMGTHGKKTKHASPFSTDNQVSKSTLEDRHRQRQWWGLDILEFDDWIAEMNRRKTLGGVYLAELKPPAGWQINRTATRAQPLPPLAVGGGAANGANDDDDDDDDDDEEA